MTDRETMLDYADLMEAYGQELLDLCAEIRAAATLNDWPRSSKVVPLFKAKRGR